MKQESLSPQIKKAIPVIISTFEKYAPEKFKVEFTAGQEWYHHSHKSLHHSGNAIDVRTKTLPDHGVGIISSLIGYHLQQALNSKFPKWFLVLVNDQGLNAPHIHVQFNPGSRMTTPGDDEKSPEWKRGVV